jgi:hypothetical protein
MGYVTTYIFVFYKVAYHGGLRGLRHEMSSLAPLLGSWVRIPLKEMDICVRYSVFLLSCV